MFTLIKKELRALFCNPVSLAAISVLNIAPAVILAVYLTLSRTQGSYAGFENVISVMSLLTAVIIPAVASASISKEYKNQTADYLNSLPISRCEIVFSKFISLSAFFLIPCLIMASFPMILSGFATVNYVHSFISLGMLAVFEIFIISLSLMLSSVTGKTLSAMVISYSAIVVSFLFGILSPLVRLLPFGTGFDKVVAGILKELSIFKKFDYIVFELFDWTSLLFFALSIVMFLTVALLFYKKSRKRVKKLKNAKKKCVASIGALLLVTVGFLPMFLPYSLRQIDVNANKLYTVADSTEKYLSSVDEPITVYIIDPYSNQEDLYNVIVRTLESGKNIKIETVNSRESKEFLKEYGLDSVNSDLLAYSMIVKSEKRWRFISPDNYFVYYNKTMGYLTMEELQYRYSYALKYLNTYYSSYDKLSDDMKKFLDSCLAIANSIQSETAVCIQVGDVIADAVAYVTAEKIPTVYSLTGHGEKGNISNSYDLSKEGKVPKDADILMINAPDSDYSEAEIKAIEDFADAGGKLYVLIDKANISMPNISSLLSYYGLSVSDEIISKDDKTIVDVSLNKEHPAFETLSASEVTVKDVSNIASDTQKTQYTYTPMLTYKSGEGENATEQTVAISVSEGDKIRLTLFTGAVTFNDNNNGIEEEVLERTSLCVSSTLSWMFDAFDSGLTSNPPKLYDKSVYRADGGDVAKIVVVFAVIIPLVIAAISVVYVVVKHLKSNRSRVSVE